MLNVHLIAHSHDDVGWRKTVEQVYCICTYRSNYNYLYEFLQKLTKLVLLP